MCVMAVAIGAAVVGTAVSAMGQMQAGKAAAAAHAQNAQTAQYQAEDRREAAEIEVAKSYTNYRRAVGQGRAQVGKTGFSSQSFQDIFMDSSAEAAVERMSIRYTAGKEAFYLERQAQQEVAAGKAAGKAAQIGAIGTVIGGIGKIANIAGGSAGGSVTGNGGVSLGRSMPFSIY